MSEQNPDAVEEAFWHEAMGFEDTDENREIVRRAIGFTLTHSESFLLLRYQIAAWLRWNSCGTLTVAKAADYVEEGVFPLVISD